MTRADPGQAGGPGWRQRLRPWPSCCG